MKCKKVISRSKLRVMETLWRRKAISRGVQSKRERELFIAWLGPAMKEQFNIRLGRTNGTAEEAGELVCRLRE
jgi:hypothetical protein